MFRTACPIPQGLLPPHWTPYRSTILPLSEAKFFVLSPGPDPVVRSTAPDPDASGPCDAITVTLTDKEKGFGKGKPKDNDTVQIDFSTNLFTDFGPLRLTGGNFAIDLTP